MGKNKYKDLSVGLAVSFFISLLGVLSNYKSFLRYDYKKDIREIQAFGYYLNFLLSIFTILSVILVFYFSFRIIFKAVKDLKSNEEPKTLASVMGFISSSALIIMSLVSEYSLGVLYQYLRGSFEVFIATVIDIPSYIGVVVAIYFYFNFLVQLKRRKSSEIKLYKDLYIAVCANFIVAFFGYISTQVFYQQFPTERLELYLSYFFGRILMIFSYIGLLIGFYLLFKITIKAFMDIKNGSQDKKLICVYGILTSFLVMILTFLNDSLIVMFTDAQMTFYIGLFTLVYFSFKYIQLLKE